MFSIIFAVFYYRLVMRHKKITVNGLAVIAPIIADCYLIGIILDKF